MFVATCDQCNADFTVFRLGVEVVHGDIERTHFICPACGYDYTVSYTNSGIRQLQQLRTKLLKRVRNKKNDRLLKDIKQRIEIGMNRLKQEVEG